MASSNWQLGKPLFSESSSDEEGSFSDFDEPFFAQNSPFRKAIQQSGMQNKDVPQFEGFDAAYALSNSQNFTQSWSPPTILPSLTSSFPTIQPAHKQNSKPARKPAPSTLPSLEELHSGVAQTKSIHHEESTLKNYNRRAAAFLQFRKLYKLDHVPALPLQTSEIQLWFTFLEKTTSNQYGSYRQNLGALRAYSRQNGYRDLEHLETDIRKSNHSEFAVFIEGLKKKLPEGETKQAKALDHDILQSLLVFIFLNEACRHIMLRDVLILALMFLMGLRGCDLYRINTDQVEFNPVEYIFTVVLKGGKMTHKKVERGTVVGEGQTVDIYALMKEYVTVMQELYQDGTMTADRFGPKLFVTFDLKLQKMNDNRISTGIITKILRNRLREFYNSQGRDVTPEEIDAAISEYSSHSLKRGVATYAADLGATDTDVTKSFRWNKVETMRRYVDPTVMKTSLTKKIKI